MKKNDNRGFTLIEMLIVIVIIGILAAALVPRLQSVQGRARDTKRKADIRTLANGLEIYLMDNGKYIEPGGYPVNTNNAIYSTHAGRISTFSGMFTSVPVDPRNIGTYAAYTGSYTYEYGLVYAPSYNTAGVGRTYDLFAVLENPSDPDRCETKLYRFQFDYYGLCGGSNPYQPYDWKKNMYDYSPNVKNVP